MNPLAFLQRLPSPSRYAHRLDQRRADEVDDVLLAHAALVAEAREACAALRAGDDAAAPRVVEASARTLLGELREVGDDADPGVEAARWIDGMMRSDRLELLDREEVPAVAKRFAMRMLHAVNLAIDSYGVWATAVDAALGPLREAHLYDLAAGTGGFARHLAKTPIPGRRLRLTSSDLDASYVAIGEEIARREALVVAFEPRNVLDLRGVGGVDLFVCTQATHHLSPGQVVRMIAGAVESAPRGILIVDLQRSLFNLAVTATFLAAFAQPLLHDGILSVQRSYAPSELLLLARIAGAERVETSTPSAAFSAMHAQTCPA